MSTLDRVIQLLCPPIFMKSDWIRNNRYTLRHWFRIKLFGVHGQAHNGEYLFNRPASWKYPRLNKWLNRAVNIIPAL